MKIYRIEYYHEDNKGKHDIDTFYFQSYKNAENYIKERGFTCLLFFGVTEDLYNSSGQKIPGGNICSPEIWYKNGHDTRFFMKVYEMKTEEEFES